MKVAAPIPGGPGLREEVGRHLPESGRIIRRRPLPRTTVFLDRDGVLVEDVHFLDHPDRLRLLPGVAEALRRLQARFALVVVTNQSGLARGRFTLETLRAIHERLEERLAAADAFLDAVYFCPHLPEAPVAAYRARCACRKPRPGLLERAAREWDLDLSRSFMVGDAARDVEAGTAAGARGVRIGAEPDPAAATVVPDLAAAADWILSAEGDRRG